MVQAETERMVEMPEKFSDQRLGSGNRGEKESKN